MKKYCFLLLIFINTALLANVVSYPSTSQESSAGLQTLSLPHFDSIQTDGNFNITINGGNQAVAIDREWASYVNARVVDNTLMLTYIPPDKSQKPEDYPTINVAIRMPVLDSISLLGNSTLNGANLGNYTLDLSANGNNTINLRGTINVAKISAHGNSNISIRWVNSDHLLLEADDNSEISLAGVAKIFEARLAGSSVLEANYLRPDVAFVRTCDYATADILAIRSLYAFASGFSSIYYYKTTRDYLDNTEISGNVLQLGHWR